MPTTAGRGAGRRCTSAELEKPAPTRADVRDAVRRYWRRWEWANPAFDEAVRERIDASVPPGEPSSLAEAFAQYERWKLRDRHVKYFVADVRQYDFFGLDWWLPLWDRAVVDAWAAVPFARRRGKRLFAEVVDRRFAAVAGMDPVDATALTVEAEAPTFLGRAVDRAAETVVEGPLASVLTPVLAPLYWRLARFRSAYDEHPLGWYGIVPPDLFARLYSGREDVHALQTLEAVGRASFVDGTVVDPPREGVLSVPYTGETTE